VVMMMVAPRRALPACSVETSHRIRNRQNLVVLGGFGFRMQSETR
jgi:hypothetical protein